MARKATRKAATPTMKKVPPKGSRSGRPRDQMTPAEEDVLYLLTQEFLTVKQAAIRRRCTPRAIRKHKQHLVEKGLLGIVPHMVPQTGSPSTVDGNLDGRIRLHAEHFIINIIQCDQRYRDKVKQGSVRFVLDGHTIIQHRNCVEVYSNASFYGETPGVADQRAMRYWSRFFTRLESEVKAILMKERSQNITRVRGEFADTRNELATQALKEHQKIRIVGDDGKVWLVADNSFSLQELEGVHKTRAKFDMANAIQPYFNDLREADGNVLLPQATSELMLMIQQSMVALQENVAQMAQMNVVSIKKFDTLIELEKARLERFKRLEPELDQSLPDYIG